MARLTVEVVYALPHSEDAVSVTLEAPATVRDALDAARLAERHPEIAACKLGIHGKVVSPRAALADGDRVEIYRPLHVDPNEARRRRAYNAALRKGKSKCG
jgi:putative ubiquitin-RnfH superfamily antitoxin RatB of RatAB toxin-antitoxin module